MKQLACAFRCSDSGIPPANHVMSKVATALSMRFIVNIKSEILLPVFSIWFIMDHAWLSTDPCFFVKQDEEPNNNA